MLLPGGNVLTEYHTHKTYMDYSQFLIRRYIIPLYKQGANTVHVIFDNPGRLSQTPKQYERERQDNSASIATGHTCDDIHGSLSIPSKWRENLINCRTCKRSLVVFLSNFFLKHTSNGYFRTRNL